MQKRNTFSKMLALGGTVMVWLPILAPIILGVIWLATRGRFLVDYLMPAELLPLVLTGGALLIWAAWRVRRWHKLITWSLGIALFLLIACQVLAQVSGLASGEIAPQGPWWILVLVGLFGYVLGVIVVGVGGILLLRDLLKPTQSAPANSPSLA